MNYIRSLSLLSPKHYPLLLNSYNLILLIFGVSTQMWILRMYEIKCASLLLICLLSISFLAQLEGPWRRQESLAPHMCYGQTCSISDTPNTTKMKLHDILRKKKKNQVGMSA